MENEMETVVKQRFKELDFSYCIFLSVFLVMASPRLGCRGKGKACNVYLLLIQMQLLDRGLYNSPR